LGELIHEKKQKSKISWHCPFKHDKADVKYGFKTMRWSLENSIIKKSANFLLEATIKLRQTIK
jgi:hypothetical protein